MQDLDWSAEKKYNIPDPYNGITSQFDSSSRYGTSLQHGGSTSRSTNQWEEHAPHPSHTPLVIRAEACGGTLQGDAMGYLTEERDIRLPLNKRLTTPRAIVVAKPKVNPSFINCPSRVDVKAIRNLVRQLESQQYDTYEDPSPFSAEILVAPLLPNFKVNSDLKYGGTTYPGLHLRRFIAEMQLYQHSHHLRCKYFPLTLIGTTHIWYQRLPENFITSWTQFYNFFLKQFQSAMTFVAPPNALSDIRQGDNVADSN